MARGHQLRLPLSTIGMHSRLVCQLPANGHLTAAVTHIAAVNAHTADTERGRGAHGSYMEQMIANVEKRFRSLVKG